MSKKYVKEIERAALTYCEKVDMEKTRTHIKTWVWYKGLFRIVIASSTASCRHGVNQYGRDVRRMVAEMKEELGENQ